MLLGGFEQQHLATKEKNSDQLEILGVATFGEAEAIKALTKKFSIWK